jgi:hypothetical protein
VLQNNNERGKKMPTKEEYLNYIEKEKAKIAQAKEKIKVYETKIQELEVQELRAATIELKGKGIDINKILSAIRNGDFDKVEAYCQASLRQ